MSKKGISLLVFAIFLMVSCTSQKEAVFASNSELRDLGDVVDLAAYHYREIPSERDMGEKIESIIIDRLLIVRAYNPDVSELNRNSLASLCKAITLSKMVHFGSYLNDPEVTSIVKEFLLDIEPNIDKSVLNGGGCAI